MNILADASLPGLDLAFPKPFHLTRYHNLPELTQLLPKQEILLCRSTLKVNEALLHNNNLRYVATASSGTDHLDSHWLNSQNIQVIDAKGSNARAVADYLIACLAFLKQRHLLKGKKAGIIGLGAVGTEVAKRLHAADFSLFTYDPLKALREKNKFKSCSLEDLYQVDLLCIHAELHNTPPYPSLNLINHQVLSHLKPGCIIINAARGGIVHENDLLQSSNSLVYCTDVYLNEPAIDERIVDKAFLCTPHIAGHSLEAKYLAVAMVSTKLHQLLHLPLPQYATPLAPQSLDVEKNSSWTDLILKIYNPEEETKLLKQAVDKQAAFIHLRQLHQFRHDFNTYFANSIGVGLFG